MMRRIISIPAFLLSCTIIIAGFSTDVSAPAGVSIVDLGVKNTIKIGLLIQTNNSFEARNGAQLAIEKANKNGGYAGRDFELIVKSMEGPWGTGSKQAVDMIFNDGVVAIIGSHDGRNAHLVEQATTKANITFMSAWSGDPTLSQAFTPWFFNSVPNDNQQAEILLNEFIKKNFRKIAVLADDDYDANSALKCFLRKSTGRGFVLPEIIKTSKSESDFSGITEALSKKMPDCFIVFTGQEIAVKIFDELKKLKLNVPVYGPLSLLGESSPILNHAEVSKNILLLTTGDWYLRNKSVFAEDYLEKFSSYPGAVAAYGYDATMIMIRAVRTAGAEKDKVHKALMETDYTGVTGVIRFDGKGNRIYTVVSPEL